MKSISSFSTFARRHHIHLWWSCLNAIVVVILAAGSGCRKPHPAFAESPDAKSVVDGNNAFALDLYRHLEKREGNLLFSPFNIYTSLGMTYAGARGQTETEMAGVLRFTLPQHELHPAFHELFDWLDKIQQWDGISFTLADSLWSQKEYPFKKAFLELIRTNYDAGVHPLDFTNPITAARQINDWFERKTDGKIKEMITPNQINPRYSRLFLCSAIYFNGKWQTQFKPSDTHPRPFYVSSDQTVTVPMMSQFSKFKLTFDAAFGQDDAIQLIEFPYSGDDLSMIVLLPIELGKMSALEDELTLTNLSAWLAKLDQALPRKVNILLPRFTFEQSFDLVGELKSLGMVSVFGPEADLSGMDGTTNLFLADAVHKAVIEVNEAGTKAVAATWVHTARKSMPTSFHADHPFIFLIRDNQTGCILFIGRVVNPLEN
jgi:serine protease inhibitor